MPNPITSKIKEVLHRDKDKTKDKDNAKDATQSDSVTPAPTVTSNTSSNTMPSITSPRYQTEDLDPSPLAQPLTFPFSNKTAPNRFLKAAMTERLSSWSPSDFSARGIPTPELIRAYQRWGEGELGLILTGNVMIFPDQLEAQGNPIIPSDAPFEGPRFNAFKDMATQAKKHGSLCVGQISHPGRQTAEALQPDPVSASDVQLDERMGMKFAKPHPATKEEIETIKKAFVHSAHYLHKSGYDGIQLHGAHGYLLAQFLSNTTNKRTDEYGGSLANRARIILEIAQEIREQIPASTGFMLGIKLNSVEFQSGGFSAEECRDLCKSLEEEGFDFVELSGGTYEELAFTHKKESTKKREAFFLEFADIITPALTKTKVYVTGGFRTVAGMVNALQGNVHGVGLARPVCQEFDIAKKILHRQVKAAIDQKLDQGDFALTNFVAGTQIKMVAEDKAPIDMGIKENVDAFMKDMQEWMGKMGEDKEGKLYGYVPVKSAQVGQYVVS